MIQNNIPLTILPTDIQQDWLAEIHPAPTGNAFRLVAARRTNPGDYEAQRITVLVLDENGFPVPGVIVAFSYSTAMPYQLNPNWKWNPPAPHRAFLASTTGAGQIDQVQGSAVNEGEPGGVTVYVLDPELPSDYVTGCGMLADHTGLHLTFRLVGPLSLEERVSRIEERLGIV